MRESQRNQAIRACEASFNTAIMSCPAWQGTVLAGSIVPDGNTATSASVGLGGRQTVNIAPAVGGVSNVVQRLESRRRSEQHRHQRAHDRQPGHQHEPVDYPGQPQCPRSTRERDSGEPERRHGRRRQLHEHGSRRPVDREGELQRSDDRHGRHAA